MIADALLVLEPRIRTQPQHVVVSKTHTTERPGKGLFLRGRWIEPELVSAFNFHSQEIAYMYKDNNPLQRRRREQEHALRAALSLFGLKGRGFPRKLMTTAPPWEYREKKSRQWV